MVHVVVKGCCSSFTDGIVFAESQVLTGRTISSPSVYLDNVQCVGSETSLLECSRNMLGEHICETNVGAGVRCGGMYV